MKPKVKFSHVSKTYNLYKKNSDKLLDLFSVSKKRTKTFYALQDISFEVFEGETIGIIGTNGSGKSTLSNLLSGAVPHSSGKVEINGEPSLIAISAGLDKNLSGIDNIQQKCLMHGLKSSEIKELKEDIIEFADLGDFIYQPVKNYSSGMKSRLGFAISVHTNPDILIIDEALSVGDQTFYQKCIDRIDQFKKEGKTIFFVSHSISQVKSISDRVIWIHFGRVKEIGPALPVLKNYNSFVKWFNSLSEREQKKFRAEMMEKRSLSVPSELNTEYHIVLSRLNRKEAPKKNRKVGFAFQMALFLLLTAFSGSLLFSNLSVAKINLPSILLERSVPKEYNQADEVTAKNEAGVMIEDQAVAYSSQQKDGKAEYLPFSSSVFVEEESKDMYKIKYNENTFYVNKEAVKLTSKDLLQTADASIEQFEPLFSESFFQSYEFFTAFYHSSYESVKEKLRGYREDTNEQGNKLLHVEGYGITYVFNEDDVAEEIVVSEINQESNAVNDFIRLSQISSTKKSHYLLMTEQFEFMLDLDKETLSMKKAKG